MGASSPLGSPGSGAGSPYEGKSKASGSRLINRAAHKRAISISGMGQQKLEYSASNLPSDMSESQLDKFQIPHENTPKNFDMRGSVCRIFLPVWSDQKQRKGRCFVCNQVGNRYTCRICGQWACQSCSQKIILPRTFARKQKSGPRRVCKHCEEVVMRGAVLVAAEAPKSFEEEDDGDCEHGGSLSNSSKFSFEDIKKSLSEDEGEGRWIECVEKISGKQLWYNQATGKIRFTPPRKPLPPVPPEMIETNPGHYFDVAKGGMSTALYNDEQIESLSEHLPEKTSELLEPCAPDWNFKNDELKEASDRISLNKRWQEMATKIPNAFEYAFPEYFYRSSFERPLDYNQRVTINVGLSKSMIEEDSIAVRKTVVACAVSDTVQLVISKAASKLLKRKDVENFMLKCVKSEEYFATLDMPLHAYSLVNRMLKSSESKERLQLKLVYRPSDLDPPRNKLNEIKAQSNTVRDEVFTTRELSAADQQVIDLEELNSPLRLKVHGANRISKSTLPLYDETMTYMFVRVTLWHGSKQIYKEFDVKTGAIVCGQGKEISFDQVIKVAPKRGEEKKVTRALPTFATLPPETRLNVGLYALRGEVQEILLAYVNVMLTNQKGLLRQGIYQLPMWPVIPPKVKKGKKLKIGTVETQQALFEAAVTGPIAPNRYPPKSSSKAVSIGIEFDTYDHPVMSPSIPRRCGVEETAPRMKSVSRSDKNIAAIKKTDALTELTDAQKEFMWNARDKFFDDPSMLAKFLLCVDWTDESKAREARRCLTQWTALSPYQALELLGYEHADTTVRLYAVNRLRLLGDEELKEVLLQITQLLKFEPYHDSALARFVVERSLASPYMVGHYFFWHLKAELHNRDNCERFYILLKTYCQFAPRHFRELALQSKMIKKFEKLADDLVHLKKDQRKPKQFCKMWLRQQLKTLVFPSRLQMTLDPRIHTTAVLHDECKFMSSKKLPLWLVFKNVDTDAGKNFIIFKSGDDLRQDILTLQMLRIMDAFWTSEGEDLELSPYTCVATGVNKDGEGVGMIEVVLDSDTVSHIQITKGGGGRNGAFDDTTLNKYLEEKCRETKKTMPQIKDTFLRSTAGYCVATFNLGIGDRHNGNIMLSKNGNLFHIDFGHFLGNFKTKWGWKRERSPFVFTQEMAYVIGGENYSKSPEYEKFVNLCCKAYNIIRKRGPLFIALFRAMKLAGMPELTCDDDIKYLRDMLRPNDSEQQAAKHFRSQITLSVLEKWRRWDNAIHNLIHGAG